MEASSHCNSLPLFLSISLSPSRSLYESLAPTQMIQVYNWHQESAAGGMTESVIMMVEEAVPLRSAGGSACTPLHRLLDTRHVICNTSIRCTINLRCYTIHVLCYTIHVQDIKYTYMIYNTCTRQIRRRHRVGEHDGGGGSARDNLRMEALVCPARQLQHLPTV